MMTQQLGFSVLSAPIAAIDRRALSQAWYSALHLARSHAPDASVPGFKTQGGAKQKVAFPSTRSSVATRSTQAIIVRHNAKMPYLATAPQDRRSMRSPLARKIEHLFLRPHAPATRATFTIDGTDARVHVSLQRTHSGLALVAVCSPRSRECVARALEQARYALAARGIALDAWIAE